MLTGRSRPDLIRASIRRAEAHSKSGLPGQDPMQARRARCYRSVSPHPPAASERLMEDRAMIASPAATDCDPARIFVAIELSKASWLVAVVTPLADRISLHRLPAGAGAAVVDLLAGVGRRVAAALGRPVEIVSCYEAGYDGFWLHRLLETQGVKNHVFDPASLQVSRRHVPRSGHRQGGQPQGADHHDRARLDVAAPPARQHLEPLVPRACRCPQRPGHGGSRSWPWRASCWSPCGATSKPAWCPPAPPSKPDADKTPER
jgi:hypothetical protein